MAEGTSPRPFQQLQYAFAAHLRDPASRRAPAGLEDRRLKIYRELFFNNIENFLANAFPVLRKLYMDDAWLALVRDFYARHQSQDPLFNGLAEEFLRYLDAERGVVEGDPPYLRELAHYEWVELALSIAEDELTPALADPNGDLLAQPPCVSPLAWTLGYEWPVHRIGPDYQPPEPGASPTWLVVYRTRQDEVKFLEINAVTARLLGLAVEAPQATGAELIARIAAELGSDPANLMEAGAAMLQGLRERDVIVGTRRSA